jgi:hypothetical protein
VNSYTDRDPELRAAVRYALAAKGEAVRGDSSALAGALADLDRAVRAPVDADHALRAEAGRWLRSVTASDPRPFPTREIERLLRHG